MITSSLKSAVHTSSSQNLIKAPLITHSLVEQHLKNTINKIQKKIHTAPLHGHFS